MPIPDYQTIMLPLLQLAADGEEIKFGDAVAGVAAHFDLSSDEMAELLPSGTQSVFRNRMGWARTYLGQAGLLTATRRGYFQISDRGRALLAQNPRKIDAASLEQYPEFVEFKNRKKQKDSDNGTTTTDIVEDSSQTPEDALASAYKTLRSTVESELLTSLKEASPSFFERVVVDVLVGMGYGGNRQDAGRAMGKSGDGGIDGIINEDPLGLDVVYIQAKRWEGVVGRPEIQKFAGALQGRRARKGVFITTSAFTKEASEYVSLIESKIILIDGERLTRLMVDHNVGVSTVGRYEVKKLDSDYFDED